MPSSLARSCLSRCLSFLKFQALLKDALPCSFAPAASGSQRRGPTKKASVEVKSEDPMMAGSQSEPASIDEAVMQTSAGDTAAPLVDRLAGKLPVIKCGKQLGQAIGHSPMLSRYF